MSATNLALTAAGIGKMNKNPVVQSNTNKGTNTNKGMNTSPRNMKKNNMTKTNLARMNVIVKKNKKGTKKNNKKLKKVNSKKNRSLVGDLPEFDNSASEIKMSKNGLRKLLKAMFLDMGLEEKEIVKMLRQLGKDEQSIKNLTKLVNKTRKKDTDRKALIIKNMNILKDSILKIYNQFDELNNNLGILFERKTKKEL